MKKIFTLFAVVLMALAIQAQDAPLYTLTTTITNDAAWGDEYASDFAFQGTRVNVEVYADDYVIIRNWAGAEGCDLKVEYDASVDVDADDCLGNILAITAYINGVEQEPLTYSKEYEGVTYNYVDLATGRTDYPVCSTTLNEDGTFYWSFVEVDKEDKTGYVELSGYFMTANYDTENIAGNYYYVGWPEADAPAEPAFYGTFADAYVGEMLDSDGNVDTEYGVAYIKDLENMTVDVYDQYVIIRDWSRNPDSPRNLKVYCSHDENESVTSLFYINGESEQAVPTDVKYIYTGYPAEAGNLYDVLVYLSYSYAEWDESNGYIMIYGYPYYYNEEGKYDYGAWGYYYIYWGYDDEEDPDAVKAVKSKIANQSIYNLAGQKVNAAYKGIVIRDGKKMIFK